MTFHPDVLAAHAEFGGDLPAMQALYDRPDHLARIAELEAENERLKKALSEQIDRDISGIFPGERALAERAGGVKVKALEDAARIGWMAGRNAWCPAGVLSDEPRTERDWRNALIIEISPTLSSLTTEPAAPIVDHPRETNDVVSHETPNPEDKPAASEGRQVVGDEPFEVLPDGSYQRRTRPAEQAVMEAMVEAAIAAMFHGHGWFPPPYAMRAALKAAMEAGRQALATSGDPDEARQ